MILEKSKWILFGSRNILAIDSKIHQWYIYEQIRWNIQEYIYLFLKQNDVDLDGKFQNISKSTYFKYLQCGFISLPMTYNNALMLRKKVVSSKQYK